MNGYGLSTEAISIQGRRSRDESYIWLLAISSFPTLVKSSIVDVHNLPGCTGTRLGILLLSSI